VHLGLRSPETAHAIVPADHGSGAWLFLSLPSPKPAPHFMAVPFNGVGARGEVLHRNSSHDLPQRHVYPLVVPPRIRICVSYVRASLLAAHASLTDTLSRLLSYPTGGPPSSRHKFHRTVSLADHSYFYVTLLRVTYHSQASILSCLLQQDRHIDLTSYQGHATSRASCGAHKIALLAYADRKREVSPW
jgi:hypothetical protein